MILCKVTGILDCGKKFAQLEGITLVQVRKQDGTVLAAADPLGVKTGDRVVICQGETVCCVAGHKVPLDAAVIAVVTEE